ncbi:MAG: hypothetical protein A2151_09330 [Candidatus Muproteobacteria bacterium RBG_16_65_34]|uniref:Lipoprotein n=1 Tax=Candidatus Muproteobacteria bacterium RBG_16_65_34 TaxID=1817760 RepID=A0A1F6TQF1_9PROT|nr:MAG: hypothetical protein A2151_09330 [Candidatus Muproteobacteria bacterium RBG_16_65_34]
MNRANRTTVFLLLASVAALAGCAGGRPALENISELAADEVVLVGRVELVPPIKEFEQELNTATSGRFRGRGHAIVAEEIYDLDALPMSAGTTSVFFEFDKDFYIRQPRAPTLYYSGAVVLMRSTATTSGYMGRNVSIDHAQLKLPGGVKFNIGPKDKAVYIGTLRYHRDAYNAVTKVEIVDDYAGANQRFTKKFGSRVSLRPVALQRAKK